VIVKLVSPSVPGYDVANQGSVSIEKVLNLNNDKPKTDDEAIPESQIVNENGEPIWKVLVFDNLGRDVISSVLRVNDLRSNGVTVHL